MKTAMEYTSFSDRDLITGLLANFYILDYGFISSVNADNTINVTHAKVQVTTEDVELPETVTKNIEVLTLSGKGFSIQWDIQEGDQVLLLGLKDYIQQVAKVTKSTKQDAFIHYTRDTMKALPLSIFNNQAKVVVKAHGGTLSIDTDKDIELNGKTSHLVTYEELAAALALHTHSFVGDGTVGTPTNLDISSAKAVRLKAAATTPIQQAGT